MLVIDVSDDRPASPEHIHIVFQELEENRLAEGVEQVDQVVACRKDKSGCVGVDEANIIGAEFLDVTVRRLHQRRRELYADEPSKPVSGGRIKAGLSLPRAEIDEMLEYDAGLLCLIEQLPDRGASDRLVGPRMRERRRMAGFEFVRIDKTATVEAVPPFK